MHVAIVGHDLPGRSFCGPNGNLLADVHVGVQVRSEPEQLAPGLVLDVGRPQRRRWVEMFRRVKLMLNRIDIELVESAESQQRPLVARVQLTDDLGAPRCARVDAPAVEWSLA